MSAPKEQPPFLAQASISCLKLLAHGESDCRILAGGVKWVQVDALQMVFQAIPSS